MQDDAKPVAWIAAGGLLSFVLTGAVVVLMFGACGGSSTDPDPDPVVDALFEDDFESGLTKWSGRPGDQHAELVPDPLGTRGTVVRFTETVAGGDIFSTGIPVEADSTYVLSFDYLGFPATTVPPGGLGGFVGLVDDAPYPGSLAWVAGTEPGQAPNMLTDDGAWHTFSYNVVPSQFITTSGGVLHIILEDFEGSGSYAADAQPNDAYFDNVVLKRP